MIKITNEDNMELMARYEDNYFDLAIVDPPYGIGANKMTLGNGKKKIYRGIEDWDSKIPDKEYFDELFRVSKNQIVWGGNYMTEYLKPTSAWLFWDKGTGDNDFADGELAWTSFDKVLKQYTKRSETFNRIHPTQKPVQLYKWLLENYRNEKDLILDTHLGSGSIAIACHYMKRNLIGYEIDKEYYDAACKRFKEQTMQQTLW